MFLDIHGHRMDVVSLGDGDQQILFSGGWIGTWQVWLQARRSACAST